MCEWVMFLTKRVSIKKDSYNLVNGVDGVQSPCNQKSRMDQIVLSALTT